MIDLQQKDELDTIEIRHRRTGRLLDMIHQGCTAARVMAFVTTLKQTGQFHIAKVVECGGKFNIISNLQNVYTMLHNITTNLHTWLSFACLPIYLHSSQLSYLHTHSPTYICLCFVSHLPPLLHTYICLSSYIPTYLR